MNWYRLESVRETLREDYRAVVAPTGVGARGNVEIWQREEGGHTYRAFLNWEADEMLVPQESLEAAAAALHVAPGPFMEAIRTRGGLWTGPTP